MSDDKSLIKKVLEIFEVIEPGTDKVPEKRFYFTTADVTVTDGGHQYIPLSIFDAAKWELAIMEEHGFQGTKDA